MARAQGHEITEDEGDAGLSEALSPAVRAGLSITASGDRGGRPTVGTFDLTAMTYASVALGEVPNSVATGALRPLVSMSPAAKETNHDRGCVSTMKARAADHPSPAFIDLHAVLSSVSDRALLADPALSALMVDYACWDAHLAEWHGRRPSRRHPDYGDWIDEGRALFDHRDELKATAYALVRHG